MEETQPDVGSTNSELKKDTIDEPIAAGNEESSGESQYGGGVGQKATSQDGTPEQDIPLAELETLLDKIQFTRRILEREAEAVSGDQNGRHQSQLAVINEIESRIEKIIEG